MIRSTLNLYLDGLMSLAQEKDSPGRVLLVEEALLNSTLTGLIQDWLLLNGHDLDSALKVKTWFSLSYEELAEIYKLSAKEVGQLLRNQRVQLLPAYRPETTDIPQGSELSCFRVEQQLSSWVDCELEDGRTMAQIEKHLRLCPLCRGRLELYRRLQTEILSQRESFELVSIEEWEATIDWLQRTKNRRLRHILLVVLIIISAVLIIAWVIGSKPEKMPNVYEIQSE